ncbi:MAG: DMT family transporter [Verrucomicrobiaceae bacterium]|nr:DMT family transporter [Verrucomicrobiaceae bacterium]
MPSPDISPRPVLPLPPAATSVRRGIVVMVLSVLAFTVNSLLLKYLGEGEHRLSPDMPLLFRAAVGIVIVLVFFRGRRPTLIRPVFRDRSLVLRGFTGLLGTAAYYWTVPTLGAGKATLICNTYVIFASIIAMLTLGEKLTAKRFFWLAAAFAGIVLLVGPRAAGENFTVGWSEILALFGAIMAAWSVVLVRQLSLEYSIGTIYLAQCVWILVPIACLAAPDLAGLSVSELALLLLAAVAAGGGQLAMNEGYRCLTVTTGATIQMLWPVSTTLGGWLLFSERFGPLQWAGAILILASVWRISVAGRRVRKLPA